MNTLFTLHSEKIDNSEFIITKPKKSMIDIEYESIKPYMERLGAH